MGDCEHKKTQIWEPHLAGARKCLDCGMVYNPNFSPRWHVEVETVEIPKDEYDALLRRIVVLTNRVKALNEQIDQAITDQTHMPCPRNE